MTSARRVMWFRRDLRLADNPALLEAAASAAGRGASPSSCSTPPLARAGAARRAFLARVPATRSTSRLGRPPGRARRRPGARCRRRRRRGRTPTTVYVAEDFGPYGRRATTRSPRPSPRDGRTSRARRQPVRGRPRHACSTADGHAVQGVLAVRPGLAAHGWARRHRRPTPDWRRRIEGAASSRSRRRRTSTAELPDRRARRRRTAGSRRSWRRLLDGYDRAPQPSRRRRHQPAVALPQVGRASTRASSSPASVDAKAHERASATSWPGASSTPTCCSTAPTRRGSRSSRAMAAHARSTPAAPPDERFAAWAEGRTGFPIVDAGMRQLARRGVDAQPGAHDRGQLPREGPPPRLAAGRPPLHATTSSTATWRRNNHGWQWVAGTGTDAAPYFRVFNPVTQGETFDPDGDYVRRWVPELRRRRRRRRARAVDGSRAARRPATRRRSSTTPPSGPRPCAATTRSGAPSPGP